MLELGQIKINILDVPADEKEHLREYTSQKLKIKAEQMRKFEIYKRSLDARSKPDIFYIYSVRFLSDDEETILKKNHFNKNLRQVKKPVLYESKLTQIRGRGDERIVVVGSGPAGLFCAYALALRGLRPILIERGAPMEERVSEVERFWESGELNEEVNVCFGEGGAGTFSDGKLNSGVKDKDGTKRFILECFVRFGAGKDILYDGKPHIGTDVLRSVIVNMRKAMEKQGVTFLFHTKYVGVEKKDGKVSGVWVKQGEIRDTIPCNHLVLAIGHSARDTFEKLKEQKIEMRPKPFAVGVRVQHRQEDIDRAQYGNIKNADRFTSVDGIISAEDDNRNGEESRLSNQSDLYVPAAYYKLTGKTSDGKGVYSFCMCPGGYVVNASSETGHLVVNGMSDVGRDSGYANAAIVVTVDPGNTGRDDSAAGEVEYGGAKESSSGKLGDDISTDESGSGSAETDVFIGVEYQRQLEKKMYQVADGKIPVQRYGDFKTKNRISVNSSGEGDGKDGSTPSNVKNEVIAPQAEIRIKGLSSNQPSVKGQWTYADVASALPEDIHKAVCEAIDQFGKKIKGFDADDTLIMGMESRTSSPVRIVRDEESLESVSLPGLYPCGEGAGYAGGILSAAMDGLRVAERIGERLMQ